MQWHEFENVYVATNECVSIAWDWLPRVAVGLAGHIAARETAALRMTEIYQDELRLRDDELEDSRDWTNFRSKQFGEWIRRATPIRVFQACCAHILPDGEGVPSEHLERVFAAAAATGALRANNDQVQALYALAAAQKGKGATAVFAEGFQHTVSAEFARACARGTHRDLFNAVRLSLQAVAASTPSAAKRMKT